MKKDGDRVLLLVQKGALVPADEASLERLKEKGFKIGDVLSAQLRKSRNPKFHRLAHAFGQVLAENLDSFSGLDAHACLKKIQWEADIGCDHMSMNVPNVGTVTVRMPRSLGFGSMDEAEFADTYKKMCEYISKTYWHDKSPEEIAVMAELMPNH